MAINSRYCVRVACTCLPVIFLTLVIVAGGCTRKSSRSRRLTPVTETTPSSSDAVEGNDRVADANTSVAPSDASSSSERSPVPNQTPTAVERICGPGHTADLPPFAQPVTTDRGISCPDGDRIAFVFDDDSTTSRRNPWQWLLQETWGLKVACSGSGGRSPLDGAAPRFCESIQELATIGPNDELFSCIDTNGRPRTRTSRGHGDPAKAVEPSRTPAVEALDQLCSRLEDRAAPGSLSLVVFAFDGVPDEGGTGSAAFEVAFADRLARCISERGIGVDVVAMPQDYAYYYVLSAPSFRAFGRSVSEALAAEAARQPGATQPVVLRLTSDSLTSDSHASIANAQMELIDWSQRDGSLALNDDPDVPWTRINTEEWLRSDVFHWAAWKLSWNARRGDWQAAAPDGTLLRPPEVHVNRVLASDKDAVFGVRDSRVVVKSFDDCGLRESISDACVPTGRLFQTLAVEDGTLELELIRDVQGTMFSPDQMKSGQTVPPGSRLISHSQGFVNQLNDHANSNSGSPLVRLMLVSPALESDPCADEVRELTQDWLKARRTNPRTPAPSLSSDCSRSRMGTLYQAFSQTKFRRFPCADSRQIGARCDMGYGMATLAEAIVGTANVQVSDRGNQKMLTNPDKQFGGPVVLKLVQVVHECPAN